MRSSERWLHGLAIATLPIWLPALIVCVAVTWKPEAERGPFNYLGEGEWGPEW